MIWILDSSFLIDLDVPESRAEQVLTELRRRSDHLLVPSQAATEYMAGAHPEDRLIAFNHLRESFRIVHTDDAHILECARLCRLSKDRGRRPRWADIQIGAVAMLHAGEVITANPRDYLAMDVPAFDHRTDGHLPAAA